MSKRWKSSWRNRLCFLAVLLATGVLAPGYADAQTNSWAYPSGGYWDDFRNWSLGVPPAISQAVLITNGSSKLVTIDSYTSGMYPDSMTVSDLSVLAIGDMTNTLSLSDAGTAIPLQVLNSLSIVSGGALLMANSSLLVGDTNTQSFVLEGPGVFSGTNFVSADIYVGYSTNSAGAISLADGQTIFTNGSTVVGFYGSGEIVLSNVAEQISDTNFAPNGVLLGLASGSHGSLSITGGVYLVADQVSLGEEPGSTGLVYVSSGQLVLTNDFSTSIGGDGVGQMIVSDGQVLAFAGSIGSGPGSQGKLTISGGSATFKGPLCVGAGAGATGVVTLTGGQLTVTNQGVLVGSYGVGQLMVSNGTLLARTVYVGNSSGSQGTLTIAAGTASVVSGVTAGVFSYIGTLTNGTASGAIRVTGGSLTVTNQSGTGLLTIGQFGRGSLVQSGGVVSVDQLLATNGSNSVFNLSSGEFNTKSTTISNGLTLFVGDGSDPATYHLLGGIHSFANGIEVRSNAELSGCGTIVGSVVVDPGGLVQADCGGALIFTGIVTNNGDVVASNGTTLESYELVVNNGLINAINGTTNFHSGFINNGVVLTSDDVPKMLSISVVGSDVDIQFTTFSNLTHYVESNTNLVSGSWTPLTNFTGTGGIMNVIIPGDATQPQDFYRVRLVVPE
jgi:hypothetical protein